MAKYPDDDFDTFEDEFDDGEEVEQDPFLAGMLRRDADDDDFGDEVDEDEYEEDEDYEN